MNPWKVILATLVIFSAGLFAGGVTGWVFRSNVPTPVVVETRPRPLPPGVPQFLRDETLKRMQHELALTSEQSEKIEIIIRESQERVREIWALVGPELKDEFRRAREGILDQLTPEQRLRFQELQRARRPQVTGGPESRTPSGSNPTALRTPPK